MTPSVQWQPMALEDLARIVRHITEENRHAAREAMTVAELCKLYLEETEAHVKASTHEADRGRMERHIKPADRGDGHFIGLPRVPGVTARYAHVPDRALVAAADRVSARIAALLDGKSRADVVHLSGRRIGT